MTLHTDGGSRGNPGPAAAGVVIRRDDVPIFEAGFVLGKMTNNQAEYHAMLRGLEIATRIDVTDDLSVYCDSELLVKQISGEYRVKNDDLAALLEKVHQLIWKFDAPPQFRHVMRAQNKRADELVNKALDARRDVVATNSAGVEMPGQAGPAAAAPLDTSEPAAKSKSPSQGRTGDFQQPKDEPDVADQAVSSDGPILARCIQAPIRGGCPAGCRNGQEWRFGITTPAGVCTHAGASLLQSVSAMLAVDMSPDEDPDDFAAIEVRCNRRECRALFSLIYTQEGPDQGE